MLFVNNDNFNIPHLGVARYNHSMILVPAGRSTGADRLRLGLMSFKCLSSRVIFSSSWLSHRQNYILILLSNMFPASPVQFFKDFCSETARESLWLYKYCNKNVNCSFSGSLNGAACTLEGILIKQTSPNTDLLYYVMFIFTPNTL